MRFIDLITVSLRNLWRQKMRSLLTILSVMVGAFLIAIMMSVGEGLETFLLSQVTTFSNEKTISVSKNIGLGEMFGIGGDPEEYEENGGKLDFTDPEAIMEMQLLSKKDLNKVREVEGVADAGFQIMVSSDYVQLNETDSKKFTVSLYGLPAALARDVKYYDVDYDLLEEKFSIVLSGDYAEAWGLNNDEIVGKAVLVQISKESKDPLAKPETKQFEFVVAGVTEKSLIGKIGMITTPAAYELGAYSANMTVSEYEEQHKAFEIAVETKSLESVEAVDKALEDLGYKSVTLEESIGQIGTVFDIIGYVLSGFGGIALLVASIGIANTLLMAIYERTREIGVMMAVGAKNVFIGLMFTFEGALLGFIGGVLGILLSWGFGRLANVILHNGIKFGETEILSAYLADYPTFNVSIITPWLIGFVIITTTLVAWFASIYPAWKASKLDPIQALRHD